MLELRRISEVAVMTSWANNPCLTKLKLIPETSRVHAALHPSIAQYENLEVAIGTYTTTVRVCFVPLSSLSTLKLS